MDEFDIWISERITFFEDKSKDIRQIYDSLKYYHGVIEGLLMARQFIRENHTPEVTSNCCFLHTAAGGSCGEEEPPEFAHCKQCPEPSNVECKVCKFTNCNHMWGKAHPIQEKRELQQWVCVNCGVTK